MFALSRHMVKFISSQGLARRRSSSSWVVARSTPRANAPSHRGREAAVDVDYEGEG